MASNFSSIYDGRRNVFELQSMLREISKTTDGLDLINPDGLFKKETAKAVRDIQKILGLAETGKVDLATWNAITQKYITAR